MNLNYDEGFNLENLSPEVQKWYAFPEDKKLINKYLNRELYISKENDQANRRRAQFETWVILLSLSVGCVGYAALLAPTGKVIRDRIDASLSRSAYWGRRIGPFLGLAIPFMIVRSSARVDNRYRD